MFYALLAHVRLLTRFVAHYIALRAHFTYHDFQLRLQIGLVWFQAYKSVSLKAIVRSAWPCSMPRSSLSDELLATGSLSTPHCRNSEGFSFTNNLQENKSICYYFSISNLTKSVMFHERTGGCYKLL